MIPRPTLGTIRLGLPASPRRDAPQAPLVGTSGGFLPIPSIDETHSWRWFCAFYIDLRRRADEVFWECGGSCLPVPGRFRLACRRWARPPDFSCVTARAWWSISEILARSFPTGLGCGLGFCEKRLGADRQPASGDQVGMGEIGVEPWTHHRVRGGYEPTRCVSGRFPSSWGVTSDFLGGIGVGSSRELPPFWSQNC